VEDVRRALRSVLDQGIEDLEIIVTDDTCGSLEPAVAAVTDPRVRYRANHRRLGFAGNHMAAIGAARGAFLAVLHEDDEYLPGFLSATLDVLRDAPDIGLAFSDCWVDDGAKRWRRGVDLRPGRHDDFLRNALRYDYFLPSTTVFRREVLDTTRTWPDTQAADLFFFIDAAQAGWSHFYIDEPLAVYRIHGGQISADDFGLRDSLVEVFGAYAFDDPVAETLRRRRLAWALVGRAGSRILRGDADGARVDLNRARDVDEQTLYWKRRALRVAASVPRIAARVDPLWKRTRRFSGALRQRRGRP
jgi:glycosyltransferase involved in cell wall biosynthesis